MSTLESSREEKYGNTCKMLRKVSRRREATIKINYYCSMNDNPFKVTFTDYNDSTLIKY